MKELREAIEAYFWTRTDRGTSEQCWLWTGSLRTADEVCNYGDVFLRRRNGRSYRNLAHRVSWEIANGPIPGGLCVLHRCDVPTCVNPGHLFLGTRADNNTDKGRKGRAPRRPGSATASAKLTEAQVSDIKRRLAAGARGTDLALEFNVSPSLICLINVGKTWKHV